MRARFVQISAAEGFSRYFASECCFLLAVAVVESADCGFLRGSGTIIYGDSDTLTSICHSTESSVREPFPD